MSHSKSTKNTGGGQAVDLMALLGRCLGNFQIVERALSTFRATGKSDLDQLQSAIESADFQAVAQISHRFRGAAGNVSATGLHELLTHAERLAQEHCHTELLMLLGRLQPEWEEFERCSQIYAPAPRNLSCRKVGQPQPPLETSNECACC